MLVKGTKKKFLSVLNQLGQTEMQIELLREVLCSQEFFEPYMLFKHIAGKKGHITAEDLKQLLQRHNINHEGILGVMQFYCPDGILKYVDFMAIVLTTNNLDLRETVTQRETFQKSLIPHDIEFAFARVLQREIDLFKKINIEKARLAQCEDFSFRGAFQLIDNHHTGSIQPDQFSNFLSNNGIIDQSIQYAIFRRLDQNRDNQIDVQDLTVSLEPQEGVHSSQLLKNEPLSNLQTQSQITPLSKSKVTRNESFMSKKSQLGKSIMVEYPNRRSMVSVQKHVTKMRQTTMNNSKPQTQRSPPKNDEEEHLYLVESLRIMAQLESENEISREELTIRNDCNILDIFASFDVDQTAKLCPSDIMNTLEQLSLKPTKQHMFLWVKRYDKDKDGRLNIREFLTALLPLDESISEIAKQRAQQALKKKKVILLQDSMSTETQQYLQQLFRTQIENEIAIESLRQKLSKRPHFNIKQLFKLIDQDGDGFFDLEDLRVFLENGGVTLTEKELQLLMLRLDRTEKERVSFSDFVLEIQPKSKIQF